MILALDTSTSTTSCALKNAAGEFYEEHFSRSTSGTPAGHNEALQELLRNCLDKSGLKLDIIEALIVGAGPGSFTGLRIGFSFMKGLSFAARIPLYTLSSLRAIAHSNTSVIEPALLVPILDARRGEVFSAIFRKNQNGEIKRLTQDAIHSVSDLAQSIANESATDKLPVVITSDSARLADALEEMVTESKLTGTIVEDGMRVVARGLIEAWLADGSGAQKQFSHTDLAELSPNYIRAVSARTIAERAAGSAP